MTDTHFAIMMGFIFAAVIIFVLEWARRGRSALRTGAVELRAEYEKNLQPGYPFRTVLDAPCPPDNFTKEECKNAMKNQNVQLSSLVASAINGELEYIETLNENVERADQDDHGLEGQLLTLKVYTDQAISAWVYNGGQEQSLDELRKVAATAVRALVLYGCPRRKGF